MLEILLDKRKDQKRDLASIIATIINVNRGKNQKPVSVEQLLGEQREVDEEEAFERFAAHATNA